MSTLLEIKGLYGGYERDVNILQGIDLTVERGEAVGIIGLNGSGKSTLGKAVMNLLPYRHGKILFDGQHIEDKTTHELAQMGIAMMHQGGTVFPNLSVWENLQLAIENSRLLTIRSSEGLLQNKNSQLSGIIPLLKRPQNELANIKADKLSGGQRHELALAMTLATNPRLVIFDEPSAGLSPKATEEMYQMLCNVREKLNITIILIEQNIAKAMEFCDKSILIRQGIITQIQTEESLKEIEIIMFKI